MSFDFNDLLKNLGGFKSKMEEIQNRMAQMRITGEAGAGMVRVTLNGDSKVTDIQIDNNLVTEQEKDVLEELIVSAFNDAQKKVREAVSHEMKNMAGGFMVPGMERFFGL